MAPTPASDSPGDTHATVSTLTRPQRRAAAIREAVVNAAREIVATEGLAALTLEAVAARADVAVATIYNRVGTRSALLVAVAEHAMAEGRAYVDAAYAAEGTPEERLLLVATAYAQFARDRPHEFRIMVEPADEPEAVKRLADLRAEENTKLAEAIRDGVAAGQVRADLDPDKVATALWASLNGLLGLAWRPGALQVKDDALDDLVATFVATVADGLRVRRT